ncbi:glycosyltransferase family 4 protein [uncultured Bacteroides sp.]|uniref:glycosyltransferase family 4 protein n=1 Tax=uncultured Bacteroides sp. TaxID=162156 RepID=UPI002587D723|nr:glycosyltransferase family 1 protein [uncultured Bacteroides sp.]
MKAPYILYDSQIFEMQRFGGISRYFCEIIRRIPINYKITILFSINYYLSKWKLAKHRIPLPRFIYKLNSHCLKRLNYKFTRKLLKRKENYLFHPTYYDPYFFQYIGDNPYVITVHDMVHEKFPQLVPDSQTQIRQKKEVINNAKRIIAISKNTKKDIIDILGISPEKIDVIYHGTSMKPFTGKYQLKLPKRYLLYVGDRTPYKNFQRFMKAFANLRKTEPDLYVVYTGKQLKKAEVIQLTQMNILKYTIHIKASDSSLSELYSRALLFVYPSLYEGFGIPILEAYACHCPIAISNTSCFPEIAGDAAAYFNPYSIDSICQTIAEIIHDKEKRKHLIRLGDIQLKRYSWEEAARRTLETYKKAIE